MSDTKPLLFEIGTEELPPKSLSKLAGELQHQLIRNLQTHNLLEKDVDSRVFATPRRLAVLIEAILENQPDQVIDKRGPAIKQAYDDQGQPTQAAMGFAKSVGMNVGDLDTLKTEKGEWLFCQIKQQGLPADHIIPECIRAALKALPIPKRMRWGETEVEFIRPVKWVVLLLGDKVIDTEILNIKADRHTYGHRFHTTRRLRLRRAQEYESLLEQKGLVVPEFEKRRQRILDDITELAAQKKAQVLLDEQLLDEVTGLVELPVPLIGQIDDAFMSLPQEVLISSMQDHQKYFPVVDTNKKMQPFFITVSNIRSKDASAVIKGNERVLRARLCDAQFFFDTDRKTSLNQRKEQLSDVLFHKKLGSLADKTTRLVVLSDYLNKQFGFNNPSIVRSAELCKTDLLTDMVGEFPELQGVMGKYYALHDGQSEQVANAIEQHYWPRFAGDSIPTTAAGQVLAIADKLDTISGIFAAGEAPTGDRDPLGLRRAALGLLRILLEAELDLDLKQAISKALDNFESQNLDLSCNEQIYEFIFERLKAYYQSQGYDTREYQAVAAVKPASPVDFDHRLKAVNGFAKLKAAETLIEANKRIGNILQNVDAPDSEINRSELDLAEELKLYETLQTIEQRLLPLLDENQYANVLQTLTELKQPVDDFFDNVMVMDENSVKRNNRIAMLSKIKSLFTQTADVSFLK